MLRRSRLAVGLVLVCGLMTLGAPAFGADGDPSGWLELDAGSAAEVHRLTPGGSADWPVDVRAPGEAAAALEVWLQPGDNSGLREYLSVELRACDQPWDGSTCAGGQRSLFVPTKLSRAEGIRMNLVEPGRTVTSEAYVLLTVWLAKDIPQEVQGSRTRIVVGVRGSGDDTSGSVTTQPAGPPSSTLADTGARLGGFALLGFLAVAAGFGFARLRGAGT